MERKLWLTIFALLLLALSASVSHGNETSLAPESPAGPGLTIAPATSAAGSEPGSSLDESGQVSISNNNNETSPSSGFNSTTEEETDPLKTSNGNTTVTNSSDLLPDTNGTIPENATSLPALETQTLATQSQPPTVFTNSSSTNKTETPAVPPPTSPSHLGTTNASQSHAPVHIDSVTPTTKLILPTITPSATTTSTASSAITTASTTTTTTTTTQKSSQAPALKDKATTMHLEAQSVAVSHKAITPSQLNVGEEIVHEGPTLDPLLAGLVSAFIIAAVIITLLLFLKLRRRDSRPEFRRLQDLPMDDMMEDTPLSMYSY